MSGNFFLNLIQLGINFFNIIYNMFVGPFDLVTNLENLFTLVVARLPTLIQYLSWVSFFIPLVYLAVPITTVLSIFVFRLISTIFHFFTDLYGNIKLL